MAYKPGPIIEGGWNDTTLARGNVFKEEFDNIYSNFGYVKEGVDACRLPFYNAFSRLRKKNGAEQIIVPAFKVHLSGTDYFSSSEKSLSVSDLDTGSSFAFGNDY